MASVHVSRVLGLSEREHIFERLLPDPLHFMSPVGELRDTVSRVASLDASVAAFFLAALLEIDRHAPTNGLRTFHCCGVHRAAHDLPGRQGDERQARQLKEPFSRYLHGEFLATCGVSL